MKKVIEIVNDLLTKWNDRVLSITVNIQDSYNKKRMACVSAFGDGYKPIGMAFFVEGDDDETLKENKADLEEQLTNYLKDK